MVYGSVVLSTDKSIPGPACLINIRPKSSQELSQTVALAQRAAFTIPKLYDQVELHILFPVLEIFL